MIQFVTFGTENYEPLLEVFHKSIKLTCKESYTLNYYSLNYDSKLKDDNLVVRKIELFKDYSRPAKNKPYVILQSLLDIEGDYFLYLDLDMVMTKNYNSKYFIDRINNSHTPLSPLFYWTFCFFDGRFWATDLCKKMGVDRNFRHHQQTNIVAYSKKHFEFLLDWYQGITDSVFGPQSYGDEEMFNVMISKYNQNTSLGVCCITENYIKGDIYKNMVDLYNGNFDMDNFYPDAETYQSEYKFENIMFYHGIKDIDKINNYLTTLI
jgi:hypothetical protein